MVLAPDTRLRALVRRTFATIQVDSCPRKVIEMKTHWPKSKRLPILVILFGMFACLPLLSNAHANATRITITNNASRDILFFFNDTATTEIYTLSLHDALPL